MSGFLKGANSGIKWTTISTIVLAISGILKIAVLTRFLDKSDFGLMAIVMFVMGFMNVFNDFGLTVAILHKDKITKKTYSSLYWFNLFIGVCLFLLLCLIAPVISWFYNEPLLKFLIPLISLNLIISSIGKLFNTIERKELKFKTISFIDIVGAFISLFCAILLAYFGFGVYSLIYSLILQYFIINTLLFFYGFKKYGLKFHYRYNDVRPFVKIGIHQVGSQFINYFNKDVDILIIGKFFSTDILGGYSLARDLVRKPVTLINPIINKVGAPALSKFSSDSISLKKYYVKMTNIIASAVIPMYVLIAIFAYPIVFIWYGAGFIEIVAIVQILCINMIMRSIGSNVGNLVIATGRTDIELRWNILVFFFTPIFVLVGSLFSIEVVALLVSLSSLILFVPSYYFLVRKMVDISFKEYFASYFKLPLKQFIYHFLTFLRGFKSL